VRSGPRNSGITPARKITGSGQRDSGSTPDRKSTENGPLDSRIMLAEKNHGGDSRNTKTTPE